MGVRYFRAAIVRSLLVLIGLLSSVWASADVWYSSPSVLPKRYAHLSLGSQPLDQSWYLHDEAGNQYVAEVDAIHHLGLMLQFPRENGAVEYGFESGAHVGYNSDRRLFIRLGSESSVVDIDSSLWTGDFSVGTFVSVKPQPWLRFFYAVGPSLYWGKINSDDNKQSDDGFVIDTRSNNDDIGLIIYQRAGVEFTFPNGFSLGASVRHVNATLDFGPNGRVDINEPHYSVLLGSQF